jgi:DNA-binding YbaB/EbfC family protein
MNINPFEVLKNAQKLQEQMSEIQEKLGDILVTGSVGGGMVEIDMNGRMEMVAVRIAPELSDDLAMLQDLIVAAYTSASDKVKEALRNEMGSIAAGFGGALPGNFPAGFPLA